MPSEDPSPVVSAFNFTWFSHSVIDIFNRFSFMQCVKHDFDAQWKSGKQVKARLVIAVQCLFDKCSGLRKWG